MQPKTPVEDRRKQDSKYNPGEQRAVEQFGSSYIDQGMEQLDAFRDDPNNSSSVAKNLEEENPSQTQAPVNQFNYERSPDSPGQQAPKNFADKVRGFFKGSKKGPAAGIIALLGGGAVGFSFMIAPGLGIIHMKEILTDDLNDSLAAMEIRTGHVYRMKLSSMQRSLSLCSDKVSMNCKFKSVSEPQFKKMQDQGFEFDCGSKNPCTANKLKRLTSIKSISYKGETFSDPRKFTQHTITDTNARSAMRNVYNPKFMSLSDNTFVKRLAKLGLKKKPTTITGDTEADNKAIQERVRTAGSVASARFNGVPVDENDSQEKTNFENSQGNQLQEAADEASKTGKKVASSVAKGAAKTVGVIGSADSLCTLYRTTVLVSQAAKVIRSAQLAAYAIEPISVADKIKYGLGVPAEVTFWNDILTDFDNNKMIPDPNDPDSGRMVENPYYGKTAMDSPLYKAAAYNEAPNIDVVTGQYTIGGTSGIENLVNFSSLGGNQQAITSTCNVVQHWSVRTVSLIVGVVAGIGSGGLTIASSVATGVTVYFAAAIAEAMLIDILAGNIIDESTIGAESGSAIFTGIAYTMAQGSMSRGLKPLKKSQVSSYMGTAQNVKNDYIAMETEAAKKTPFDIYNQYSFLGSMSLQLASISYSPDNIITKTASLASLPLSSLTDKASANAPFNPERLERCNDPIYNEIEIAADVGCNVRYGLTQAELNLEAEDVLNYMIPKYVDDDTGEPQGDYARYVESCFERTAPLGDQGVENEDEYTDGTVCYSDEPKYQYFRVFRVDESIHAGLDEDPLELESATNDDTNSTLENSGGVSANGWRYPTVKGTPLSRGFSSGHTALDIQGGSGGGPVYAARDGEVVDAGNITSPYIQPCNPNGTVQQVITIRHQADGQTLWSAYHHVEQGSIKVKPGDKVKAGDKIAQIGNTGCSFGAHLHFEIWQNQIYGSGVPKDPAPIVGAP